MFRFKGSAKAGVVHGMNEIALLFAGRGTGPSRPVYSGIRKNCRTLCLEGGEGAHPCHHGALGESSGDARPDTEVTKEGSCPLSVGFIARSCRSP